MKLNLLRVWWATLLLLVAVSAQAQPLKAWGYIAWWMPDGWRELPLQDFQRLVFFDLAIDAQGAVPERNGWPERWGELRSAAAGTPIDVTLRCFDASVFSTVFSSAAATDKLLHEAELLVSEQGMAGIQLDMEIYTALSPQAIAAYRSFIARLSQRLHHMSPARQLTVFFNVGDAAALYDAPTLAQVDYIVLQGYDAHWQHGEESGPISPLAGNDQETWTRSLKLAGDAGASREKLVMSFPLYGYEWPVQSAEPRAKTTGPGRALYFSAPQVGPEAADDTSSMQTRLRRYGYVYEPLSASSYYTYKHADRWYAGWFEDAYSLRQKAAFLQAERVSGVAFFALGYDKGELVRGFLHDHQQR